MNKKQKQMKNLRKKNNKMKTLIEKRKKENNLKTETIKLSGTFELFDGTKLKGEEYYDVMNDKRYLNQQVYDLLRRNFKSAKEYFAVVAERLELHEPVQIGCRAIEFSYFSIFDDRFTNILYLDKDGTIRMHYIHPDKQKTFEMELYLLADIEIAGNPLRIEDYLYIKEPIRADEKFLEAFGFTKEEYEIIPAKEGE